MSDQLQVNKSTLRLMRGDITDIEIESFVFYAREDLVLGSGYGTAITMRGGPPVAEELKQFGSIETTEAVVTGAGRMKSKFIVHAAGPKFQEEDMDGKLKRTIRNALAKAEEKGIKQIAFPAMGAGFYGVPLDQSAEITLTTLKEYLGNSTQIEDVVVCLMDGREYKPFQSKLANMN